MLATSITRPCRIAASAVLLGQVANADLDISSGERERLQRIFEQDLGLSTDLAASVSELAVDKVILDSLDSHKVWAYLNEKATKDQRRQVIEALFDLASVDAISGEENEQIRLIAKALGFQHQEFIDIRLQFREHLSHNRKPD